MKVSGVYLVLQTPLDSMKEQGWTLRGALTPERRRRICEVLSALADDAPIPTDSMSASRTDDLRKKES